MSDFWRVFVAVAISVASQGILAPVVIWWLVRHYRRQGRIASRQRSNSRQRNNNRGSRYA